ncbi:MAG: queuosine precursor transporter [Pseudomonadota bacterium]
MTRLLPGVIAMAIVVVASNILVQILILDGLLTWGAFTYPIAFLVTDLMNRLYGASQARRVVFVGFLVGIVCSLIGSQIIIEFEPGVTGPAVALRIAVGSAIAFLTAQLLDVAIFDRLRAGRWWRAPVVSSIFGSTADTALFFTIAFSALISFGPGADAAIGWAQGPAPLLLIGPDAPLWVTLALADWCVKLIVALVALVPFRAITARFSAVPQ